MWHPNYAVAWNVAGCVKNQDCNSPGYATQLECCKGQYGGQVGGACLAGLATPPTNAPTNVAGPGVTKWYADYGTSWTAAGCKSTTPNPIYATTLFGTQLECCRGAYGGQVSGTCLGGLPNPPTKAPTSLPTLMPTSAAGAGGQWYADYDTAWSIAGCKNTLPLPIYTIVTYGSQLECCKAAYGGQTSNACVQGLPNPPTKAPTAQPTSKPTAMPTAMPTATPTTAKPV